MNTDANAVVVSRTQFVRDEEDRLADRPTTRLNLPNGSNPQSETPCSCPSCFPMWD